MHAQTILDFWFKDIDQKQWWAKDNAFDALIKQRFGGVHEQATRGELFNWRKSAEGRLAEIIILDQFSRNIFRDLPRAFAYDGIALVLAQEATFNGADKAIPTDWRSFMYMPFMHSESLAIHEQAVKLFDQPGLEYNFEFELKHKIIIEKFGRYPHRNQILNRQSTPEELEFLRQPGSSF